MVYLLKVWFAMRSKDPDNNWVSPDEVEIIDGKKYLKNDNSKQIKIRPSESMSKSKKIQSILKI